MGERLTVSSAFLFLLVALQPVQAAEQYRVYLSNTAAERHPIGSLSLDRGSSGDRFSFELDTAAFGDYFLSMRPFRCLQEGAGRMLCYLPYPYEKPDSYADDQLQSLEYDFLFIQRTATEYGIDPWNGLYYTLSWLDGELLGQAHAVDLDLLAAPPESGVVYPISADDLHTVDPAKLWLPTLVFERQGS